MQAKEESFVKVCEGHIAVADGFKDKCQEKSRMDDNEGFVSSVGEFLMNFVGVDKTRVRSRHFVEKKAER